MNEWITLGGLNKRSEGGGGGQKLSENQVVERVC